MDRNWQPIETAPEGNDTDGPLFDVTWLGEQHRYLPLPSRAIDCYRERGTVKMKHGYPAVTTIFNPQPTHWMAHPGAAEPEEDDEGYPGPCTDPDGHDWAVDEDNENISRCSNCGADGNA